MWVLHKNKMNVTIVSQGPTIDSLWTKANKMLSSWHFTLSSLVNRLNILENDAVRNHSEDWHNTFLQTVNI